MTIDYGTINDRSPHVIADLLELKCFFELNPMSRGDVETIVEQDGGAGLKSALKIGEYEDATSSAEKNSRVQELSEDVFAHLMYRADAFDDWYPFKVANDVLEMHSTLSSQHRIYALLLICSRLRMLPPSKRIKFAADFELLSVEALKGLCSGWKVFHFGSRGTDRGFFGNKFRDAIAKLADLLKDSPIGDQIQAISHQDVGDGGIDVVVVNTFDDAARGSAAFFAQCAAQQDGWPEKVFEAHHTQQRRWIHFFHEPGNILAIPLCYRGSDGKWISDSGFNAIIIDRLRMVKLISQRPNGIAAAVAVVPSDLEKATVPSPRKRRPVSRRKKRA